MHSCFWLWISPLLSPEYGANKMLFSGHFQKCLTDAFCNFLHIASYRCSISTLQPAILFIWIAVSAGDTADPICFIYRIRSSPCRKMTGASFPAGRAYGGQEIRIFFKSIYQDEQGKH